MRNVLLLLCVLLPLASQARTIEDVTLPESLQVNDATLQLNGAGVRSKYFVDVYVAALYLPALQQDARRIVQADEPQSVRLAIISSCITRDRLLESIEDRIRQSAGADFPRYKPMLQELWDALTFEVKIGDQFDFTWVPGKGTEFYRNSELLRVLPQFEFKQVLFGIWLGDDPVQDSLKTALLTQ